MADSGGSTRQEASSLLPCTEERRTNTRKISHELSRILRHAAPDLGLTVSPDGFVPVHDVLQCGAPRLRGVTEEDVRHVVETNDKQRFKLVTRVVDGRSVLCVRANQGHSIKGIHPELLLTRVDAEALSAMVVVHGTFMEPWKNCIQTEGLSRMTRNHIHFAKGLPKDKQVISGMRRSCQVYVFVDGGKCATDGIEFFESDNGVLLSAGVDNEGILPVDYFSHATDSSGAVLLDHRER